MEYELIEEFLRLPYVMSNYASAKGTNEFYKYNKEKGIFELAKNKSGALQADWDDFVEKKLIAAKNDLDILRKSGEEESVVKEQIKFINSLKHVLKATVKKRLLSAVAEDYRFFAEFNTEPDNLLNCCGDVVDLKTGEILKEHDYKFTRSTSVRPDKNMKTPHFDNFFKQTFQTKEIIAWMGYYFGSCLRGDNKFQVVLFLLGSGNDGKSVLDGVISDIMGGYSKAMDSVLLDERFINKETDTKFADLLGVRYAHQQEIQRNARLNIENFKRITGGDKVEQRARYNQGSDGRIQASFAIFSNEFYKVDDLSDGTWRRMRTYRIKKREFTRDPDLPEKLKQELPGILHKLIVLAQKTYTKEVQDLFREENTPQVMREYKESLRGNSNVINMFISSWCVHEVDSAPNTSKKGLWEAFKAYAYDERNRPSQTDFYHALSTLGFVEKRNSKMRFYADLNLKPEHERE